MSNSTTIPEGHKACTQCGAVLPTTAEYFNRSGKYKGVQQYYSICRDCTREKKRQRYTENRAQLKAAALARYYRNHEQNIERARRYKQEHREALSCKEREYHQRNAKRYAQYEAQRRARIRRDPKAHAEYLEHRRQYGREWRERNLPERLRYEAEYRENNRALVRRISLAWARRNPAYVKMNAQRRRARMRAAAGSHTVDDIRIIYSQQNGRCWWCGAGVGDDYHIDHRIPLAQGGSNDAGNIVIACPACNLSKGGKLPHEWIGRLL